MLWQTNGGKHVFIIFFVCVVFFFFIVFLYIFRVEANWAAQFIYSKNALSCFAEKLRRKEHPSDLSCSDMKCEISLQEVLIS